MITNFKVFLLAALSLTLVACGGSNHNDLRQFISEVKARPAGTIASIPPFKPYEAFIYSAASLRSPFDKPVDVQQRVLARSHENVKPDFTRNKEYLERFDFNSLSMVGTLEQSGVLWALIQDRDGGIHRVREGNFLGQNHGRIVSSSETKLDIIEIVSDGLSGWLERPRVLALSEKE